MEGGGIDKRRQRRPEGIHYTHDMHDARLLHAARTGLEIGENWNTHTQRHHGRTCHACCCCHTSIVPFRLVAHSPRASFSSCDTRRGGRGQFCSRTVLYLYLCCVYDQVQLFGGTRGEERKGQNCTVVPLSVLPTTTTTGRFFFPHV